MKKIKFITCIYTDLYGTELGGRPSRYHHYRWSLISLLKMTDADFICYTSNREYDDLCNFFYLENKISKEKLEIKIYDLENHYFKELFEKYKDYEYAKKGDRCIELQWMKFKWLMDEDMTYDYYFWIDSGLSHCGLIPNKYLTLLGPSIRGYYESSLFNNVFLTNLIKETGDKFSIIGKENKRNFWSDTVNPKHFITYNNSIHIIGGLFGGKKDLIPKIFNLFKEYGEKIATEDQKIYHEEDIMTLMFRNHEDMFNLFNFDIWWHEDERIKDFDIEEHTKINKSFYKILEKLNEFYE